METSALYKRIDEILWNDWDPIGVNDFEDARDEYYSYIPAIFELVNSGATREKIATQLHKFETYNMGLSGSYERCLQIADEVLK